jgi:hypothetical protein
MPTTTFFTPDVRFQSHQGTKEQCSCAERRRITANLRSRIEPEQRLWKLSMEAACLTFGKVELIAFLFLGFLGVLVSTATVYCGTELFHGVNSGALEQTVQTLLSR